MKLTFAVVTRALCALTVCWSLSVQAQRADNPGREGGPNFDGPGGPGRGGFGPGEFGGMMGQETKLVKQFDNDGDGRLNTAERKAAREFLQKERAEGRGPRGFGGR